MNKILTTIFLLCVSLLPAASQGRLVDPDDGPGGIGWEIAEVDGAKKASLPKAFEALTADNSTIKLLIGTQLSAPLAVNYSAVLNLDGKTLECASGTALNIVSGKLLTLRGGTLKGSFELGGTGSLFAGKEVKLSGVGITVAGETLYRILIELPGTEAEGSLANITYGTVAVKNYAREGKVLCCWIPQSVAARAVTFNYTPSGSSQVVYGTEQLTATQHAEGLVPSTRATDTGATPAAEIGSTKYPYLADALKAATAGTPVNLLRHALLGEVTPVAPSVKLDLKGYSLSSTDKAGFETDTKSGSLLISNGSMNGTFIVSPEVTIDRTVVLTASILLDNRQVYRTRVKLPAGTTAVSFSYAGLTARTATVLTESDGLVAYPWLPAYTADKLVASMTTTSGLKQETKHDVVIQANHDNATDFTLEEVEAVLKKKDGTETSYESFHNALLDAAAEDGSKVLLKRNVQFAYSSDDKHDIKANVITELCLEGYTLNAGNSILDASAPGCCLMISDHTGRGHITGTFSLKGNVFIDPEIIAGNIGVVQNTANPKSLLYRVLVSVDAADGLMNYSFASTATASDVCLVKDKTACIWLPVSSGTLTLKKADAVYTAPDVRVSATHSNTVAVAKPSIEAYIGTTPYTTLKAAFGAVNGGETISLATNATFEEPLTIPAGAAVVLDLNRSTLTGKGQGAFRLPEGSTLHLKNGSVAGILDVTAAVAIDQSVLLTAAVTSGGRQVYRTRLLLTADDKGKALSYTYGTATGQLLLLLDEGTADATETVAYCWLQARPATSFVLLAGDTSRTRTDVAIQANHDNSISLLKGDIEAILYEKTEDPSAPGTGRRFETFHDALNAAGQLDGSQLRLQRNVQFSGAAPHSHVIEKDVVTQLCLQGYNLTATNCTLDASFPTSCLWISDAGGTGRITGTFRINGNVYIGKDITASYIGTVQDGASGAQLYRALVQIDTPTDIPDGSFGTYSLGTGVQNKVCYIKNKLACVWLPISVVPETFTLVAGGKTYQATGVQAIASHSNTITVHDPDVIAMIGTAKYTSLADAFAGAVDGDVIVLKQSTVLSTPVHMAQALKLELGEYTLTFQDKGACVAEASGSLVIASLSERGIIAGNPAFTGNICVSGSVSMSGLVSLTTGGSTATVYRCRLYLPEGALSGTYTYGGQSGALRLIGEKNATNQFIAYVWLRSETGTRDLTVSLDAPLSGTRTLTDVLIQATHNNQFDMESGDNVARVGSQYYPSLKTAIDAVNMAGGGTLILVMDQPLRGIQSVTSDIRFDLNGKKLSLTADAGFDVKDGHTLLVTDDSGNADKGYLYGTMLINGAVYVDARIRMSGTVVKKGVQVQRLLVDKLPVAQDLQTIQYTYAASGGKEAALVLSGTACLWLGEVTYEEDLQFSTPDGILYESTLQPSLTGHNKRQDAYRLVRVEGSTTWADDTNKDCNVVIAPDAVLTLATAGKLKTLHRLTLRTRSQVVCNERVLATGGIVYERSFAVANRWEAFSLPFAAQGVTAMFDGEPVSLNPNLSDGTGGHFWLKTLQGDGTFKYVTDEQIRSNVGYILAVPTDLTTDGNPNMAIRFASAPNQFLQRTALEGVAPATRGFVQLATGILCDLPVSQPFYLLNTEGTEYVRQMASVDKPANVPPFGSYLLADKETTGTLPTLRMGDFSTGNEELVPSSESTGLRIQAVRGGIVASADKECLLRVYTLSGRQYLQRRIQEGSYPISLPAGIYIVNREKVCVMK